MKMLDLFSGIGGFALAAQWNWGDELDLVGFCEIDKYAQKVLNKNFPSVTIHNDITKLDGNNFKDIDLITGGFPCQDISIAGKGVGIEGERSGLWSEMYRIISEVRPRYAIIENVPMLIHRGIERVLCDLTEIGYDCEWQIIGADEVGAWHRRKRIWICAYPRHDESSGWKESKKRHEYKRGRNARSESASLRSDVSNANNSRHMDRQTQEQPTETRVDAFRESESSGTYERNVSDTDNKRQQEHGKPKSIEQEIIGEEAYFITQCGSGDQRQGIKTKRWKAEPDVGRVANGVSNRVDRLKGLGNAIVPQVAYEIMKRIRSLKRNTSKKDVG